MNDLEIAKMYLDKASNTEDKDLEFLLSFVEYKRLVIRKKCAYTGEVFSEYKDGKPIDMWRSRTLDRIDNAQGYITGNVVAVCGGVNRLKALWENPNNPLTAALVIKIATVSEKVLRKQKLL